MLIAPNGQGNDSIALVEICHGLDHSVEGSRRLTIPRDEIYHHQNLRTTKCQSPGLRFSPKIHLSSLPPTHRPPNKQPHIRHDSFRHSAQRPTPLDPLRNRAPSIRSSRHGPFNKRLRLGLLSGWLIRGLASLYQFDALNACVICEDSALRYGGGDFLV
jgi:hypothetical protein